MTRGSNNLMSKWTEQLAPHPAVSLVVLRVNICQQTDACVNIVNAMTGNHHEIRAVAPYTASVAFYLWWIVKVALSLSLSLHRCKMLDLAACSPQSLFYDISWCRSTSRQSTCDTKWHQLWNRWVIADSLHWYTLCSERLARKRLGKFHRVTTLTMICARMLLPLVSLMMPEPSH